MWSVWTIGTGTVLFFSLSGLACVALGLMLLLVCAADSLEFNKGIATALGMIAVVLLVIAVRAYLVDTGKEDTREDLVLAFSFALGVSSAVLLGKRIGVSVFFWLLGLVIVASIIVSLYQVFLDKGSFFPIPGYSRYRYLGSRAGGFFNSPNQFASFLGLASLLLLVEGILGEGRRWRRGFLIGIASMGVLTILLTKSRAATAFFFVALVFSLSLCGWALKSRRRRSFSWKWCISIILALTFLSIFAWVGFTKIHRARAESGLFGGMAERSMMREVAVKQIQEQPLFGAGPGSYKYYAQLHRSPDWPPYLFDVDPKYAHCDLLQIVGEYGILGATLVGVCLLFLVLVAGVSIVKGDRARSLGFAVVSIASIIYVGLHSGLDFPLRSPANAFLFGLLVGAPCVLARKSAKSDGVSARIGKALIGAFCLSCLVLAWRIIPGAYFAEIASHEEILEPLAAIETLQRAIVWDQNAAIYRYRVGHLWDRMGRRFSQNTLRGSFARKALPYYRDAHLKSLRNVGYIESLAICLDQLGEYQQAEFFYEKALKGAPFHRRLRVNHCLHRDAWARADGDVEIMKEVLVLYENVLARYGNGDKRLVVGINQLKADLAKEK